MTRAFTAGQVLEILRSGAMAEKGLLPYSSNHSFLVTVGEGDLILPAVYKPQRGENPLWDFEWGTLCKREAAAYLISAALEWDLVPPTVLRDGSRGLGSVQLFIDHDSDAHYFTVNDDARYALAFRQLSLFDFIVNNADRKSGHCLIGSEGRVWAIDHGICFHTEYKLRTVIWEFSCAPIEPELRAALAGLREQLSSAASPLRRALHELLAAGEIAAMARRLEYLLRSGAHPAPSPQRRNYPWPPV